MQEQSDKSVGRVVSINVGGIYIAVICLPGHKGHKKAVDQLDVDSSYVKCKRSRRYEKAVHEGVQTRGSVRKP